MLLRLFIIAFVGGIWIFQISDNFSKLPSDNLHPLVFILIQFIIILIFWGVSKFVSIKYISGKAVINLINGIFVILTFICGYLYGHSYGEKRLSELLNNNYAGNVFEIQVTLDDLPKKTYFGYRYDFKVLNIIQPNTTKFENFPKKVRLNEYTKEAPIKYGSVWQIKTRLYPIHSSYSPHSFDYEGWLYKNEFGARGSIRKRIYEDNNLSSKFSINKIREKIVARLDKFEKKVQDENPHFRIPELATVLGLGVQTNLEQEKWDILRQSGTIHLFSISGIHVTLIAVLLAIIVNFFWRRNFFINHLLFFIPYKIPRLCNYLSAQSASITLGLICAWAYAVICGFSLPTERTVIMLTISYLIWIKGYQNSWFNVLALTFLIITVTDPMAVLDYGFWLSFTGVCILIIFAQNQSIPNNPSIGRLIKPTNQIILFIYNFFKPFYNGLIRLSKVQLIFAIVLIPLLVLFFNQWSTISVIANLIAVPLISWIVVPVSILLVFFPFKFGFEVLQYLQDSFFVVMGKLVDISPALLVAKPSVIALILASIGVVFFLLPKGVINKWLVILFLLPIIFPFSEKIEYGEAKINIFDVGSGLSVLVQTQNHSLLYDTGIKIGNYSPANFVIIPLLNAKGIEKLDRVILSHSDSDHAGGFIPILKSIPIDSVLLGDNPRNWGKLFKRTTKINHQEKFTSSYCQKSWQQWAWDGVEFTTIQAELSNNTNKNDLSCILKINSATNSILLTGDIEESAMAKLTNKYQQELASDYLLIPHHGSPTSEYQKFYQAVNAKYAIVSGGLLQKNYPSKNLVKILNNMPRFNQLYHTWYDGTVSINLPNNHKIQPPKGYRKFEPRYWHQATTL